MKNIYLKSLNILITLIFIIVGSQNAKSQQYIFQKTLGVSNSIQGRESGNAVEQTNDGGYIVVGESDLAGLGGTAILVVKTDDQGVIQWQRRIGGTGSDIAHDVKQTSNGEYIIIGQTSSFGSGSADLYVIRLDANGGTVWSETFGGAGTDVGFSIIETGNNDIVFTGTATNSNADVYLIKVNSTGGILWSQTFDYGLSEQGKDVIELTDGYLITGNTSNKTGIGNVILIRTDIDGNELWARSYDLGSSSDVGNSLYLNTNGEFAVAGNSSGNGFLFATNSSGTVQFAKDYGAVNLESVQQTVDGGYILSGTFPNGLKAILAKTDAAGNPSWSTAYAGGTSGFGSDAKPTTDGGFIFTGQFVDPIPSSLTLTDNIFLIKTNPVGSTGGCETLFGVLNNNISVTEVNITPTIGSLNTSSNPATNNLAAFLVEDISCFTTCTALSPVISTSCPNALCPGELVDLNTGSGFDYYLWSTNENTQIITVGEGTYAVFVSDVNGCWGTDNITITTNPAISEVTYTANVATEIWEPGASNNPFGSVSGEVLIEQRLTIPSGANITIKGMTFRFGPEAEVIVERGVIGGTRSAKLTLDNTTFTVFDCCNTSIMWRGIQVHGYPNQSQLAGPVNNTSVKQGHLIVKNNSLIEHARRAMVNSSYVLSTSSSGGIIQAANSMFRNNGTAAALVFYRNKLPITTTIYIDDLSYFNNCNFIRTQQQLNDPNEKGIISGPPFAIPYAFTVVALTWGVKFKGNTFQNSATWTPYDERGTGIFSYYSYFRAEPLGSDRNNFRVLYYGINAIGTVGLSTSYINDNYFYQTLRGVLLNGVDYATVTRNDFVWNVTSPPATSYGLYLQGCTSYQVEENNFENPFPPAQPTAGTIVWDSGPVTNKIFRNTYINHTVGCLANEVNDDIDDSREGLEFLCNEYIDNDFHIAVIDGEISELQGKCDGTNHQAPAGNTFTHVCPFPSSDYHVDKGAPNWSGQDVNYYHHLNGFTTPDCYTNDATAPNAFGTEVVPNDCNVGFVSGDDANSSCPATWNGGCYVSGSTVVCLMGVINDYEAQIKEKEERIDDGDTKALLKKIAQGNPGHILNALLAASPLSDEVLIAAINANLPPGILKQILMANSPLSKAVMDALNNISVPNGIMNQINSVQAGTSPREELELDIAWDVSRRKLTVDELVRWYLNDSALTVSARLDNVHLLLRGEREERTKEKAVSALIANQKLAQAQQEIALLFPNGNLSGYAKLMQVEIALRQEPEKELALAQKPLLEAEVRAIAADTTSSTHFKAQALLSLVFGEQFPEQFRFPVQSQNKMGFSNENTGQAEDSFTLLDENHKLRCFPNPFSDYTTIEAYVPDRITDGQVVITNLLGVVVKKYPVEQGYNAITILNGDLPKSGVYFYALKGNNRILEQSKLVILK